MIHTISITLGHENRCQFTYKRGTKCMRVGSEVNTFHNDAYYSFENELRFFASQYIFLTHWLRELTYTQSTVPKLRISMGPSDCRSSASSATLCKLIISVGFPSMELCQELFCLDYLLIDVHPIHPFWFILLAITYLIDSWQEILKYTNTLDKSRHHKVEVMPDNTQTDADDARSWRHCNRSCLWRE